MTDARKGLGDAHHRLDGARCRDDESVKPASVKACSGSHSSISAAAQRIINLIQIRYGGYGRSYVYVSGKAKLYNGKPEIVLTDAAQLSDVPPGT